MRWFRPSTAKAASEAKDIQALIDFKPAIGGYPAASRGTGSSMPSRCARPNTIYDESQVKPYFELNNVLENGVFYAAHELYGLTFKERKDIPVWQPDVRVFRGLSTPTASRWRCGIATTSSATTRMAARGWTRSSSQSKLLGTLPVVFNVANFEKPAPGQPALLSFDDVTTMFHEFGHALHGMFADTEYPSLSGTQVPRDFVEFPSQFNEHWASYPAVFAHYAKHYKTGEPMPADLAAKIEKCEDLQPGLRFHRDSRRVGARSGVAHAAGERAAPGSRRF